MWVNIPYSCFYLSPLFQPERLQPNMLFTPPVSPAQLTVGVVLIFEEGLMLSLLDFFFIRTWYAKWLSKQFRWFHAVWTYCAVASMLTSDICTWETHRKETEHFLLIHMKWRASVSVSVSVCKKKPSVCVLHLKRGNIWKLLLYVW